jgi:C4-dicarboxylate transporter DctM subunit
MLIVAATQIFGWVLTRAQIPQKVANFFVSNVHSPLVFMISVILILLVAGCFIDAVPNMLIFAPIFVPAAQAYGINLVYFGVIMVVALCVGLVTPPVGINLFVASNVGDTPVHRIIPHIWGLLLTCVAGLVVLMLCPGFSTWLPSVLHS